MSTLPIAVPLFTMFWLEFECIFTQGWWTFWCTGSSFVHIPIFDMDIWCVCVSARVRVCDRGRADPDHRAATVPAGHSGQQGGVDLQSLWSPWTLLPVVQRQRGGQSNIVFDYRRKKGFDTFYTDGHNSCSFLKLSNVISKFCFVLWCLLDFGCDWEHTRAGPVSFSPDPPRSLYL